MRIGYNWGADQINALQSFTYNLGIGSLNQLTANGTRSDDEIAEAMVKYVNAGGEPQPGLVARRRREQLAFINPSNQNVQQVVSQPVQQQLEEVDVTTRKRGGARYFKRPLLLLKKGGGEILNEVAVNQRRYQPSPSDGGYRVFTHKHRSRFDINDPSHDAC